jgi:hypothetical protein
MSYVIAASEMMTAAATDLAGIGSDLSEAHMAAAAPTVALVPAAADEVSAAVTHLFSRHAAGYQAVATQAAAFHDQFVQHLTASAGSFAHAEAANTALFQPVRAAAGITITEVVDGWRTAFAELPGQLYNGFIAPALTMPPLQAARHLLGLPADILVLLLFDTLYLPPIPYGP